jgi:hypothetical protein
MHGMRGCPAPIAHLPLHVVRGSIGKGLRETIPRTALGGGGWRRIAHSSGVARFCGCSEWLDNDRLRRCAVDSEILMK